MHHNVCQQMHTTVILHTQRHTHTILVADDISVCKLVVWLLWLREGLTCLLHLYNGLEFQNSVNHESSRAGQFSDGCRLAQKPEKKCPGFESVHAQS